jgi:hypothetical protein
VVRSETPVRLARLTTSPFTDRLVAKFDLSIHGWRGKARLEDAARAGQATATPAATATPTATPAATATPTAATRD